MSKKTLLAAGLFALAAMLWVPQYHGNGNYEFFLAGNVDTRQLMLNVAVATLAGALLCNMPWRWLNPFRFKWFPLAFLFVILAIGGLT
ncbi:MAG: hypothetical protein ACR2II_06280 [Chthoniobacterales bacterium]